jgi:hypothetical protein
MFLYRTHWKTGIIAGCDMFKILSHFVKTKGGAEFFSLASRTILQELAKQMYGLFTQQSAHLLLHHRRFYERNRQS